VTNGRNWLTCCPGCCLIQGISASATGTPTKVRTTTFAFLLIDAVGRWDPKRGHRRAAGRGPTR
jgi:hypothetical protein